MQGRHVLESSEGDECSFLAAARNSTSSVLRRLNLVPGCSGGPRSSAFASREQWTKRERGQTRTIRRGAHGWLSLFRRALDVPSTRRRSGCLEAGVKRSDASHFVEFFREKPSRVADAITVAPWCIRDGIQQIRPVSSMAPSSGRRFPRGCHASDGNTKASGGKRRALEGKDRVTNGGRPIKVSKAATRKVERPTPAHKQKAVIEKVEVVTRSERRRGSKKKEKARDSVTTDIETKREIATTVTQIEQGAGFTDKRIKQEATATDQRSKQEAAFPAGKDTLLRDANGLFLAHREKALRTGKYLGAHISAAGGPHNAPVNCHTVGGQAFAFFLKNQRRWESPPIVSFAGYDLRNADFVTDYRLEAAHGWRNHELSTTISIDEESAQGFKEKVGSLGLNGPQHILPHGSYLINLANPDSSKRKISYAAFLDDLRRCEQLGIHRYVFHPGSTVGACTKSEGLANVASCLNEALDSTQQVTILLENMAGQKNVLCSTFEDLRDIIGKVKKKDRVGVCLDTCHLLAAGFDIRTPDGFERIMNSFDAIVGMKYLKGMHINDSKSGLSSGLDRHEHLGKGTIGIAAFKFIMQHPHWFKGMPLIIETPEEGDAMAVWRDEIRRLYEFVDA